jgi:cellulose biosynthesis protein BcsQ
MAAGEIAAGTRAGHSPDYDLDRSGSGSGGLRSGSDRLGSGSDRVRSGSGMRVVAVANEKGRVGKTTLANNVAVALRARHPELEILVVGLDDQDSPDAMFAREDAPVAENAATALRRGGFDSAIRLGEYGVHYVPSSARMSALKREVVDPFVLKKALQRTSFHGVVIIDTASDLEILTESAIAASDLTMVPVTDQASLVGAQKVFDLLERWGRPSTRGRVVLSMVDQRVKYQNAAYPDALAWLLSEVRRRGFPIFQSFLSRSPRVEALAMNPERRTLSILEAARGTLIHSQLNELADDLMRVLESPRGDAARTRRASSAGPARPEQLVWLRPLTAEAALAVRRQGQNAMRVGEFPFFIGRRDPDTHNDLAIPDHQPWQVSRRHAHLIERGGRIGVIDLGSTHGTWVGDRQLGGHSGDPGPAFFGAGGGVLILGMRQSRYAFEVSIATAQVAEQAVSLHPSTAATPVVAPAGSAVLLDQ